MSILEHPARPTQHQPVSSVATFNLATDSTGVQVRRCRPQVQLLAQAILTAGGPVPRRLQPCWPAPRSLGASICQWLGLSSVGPRLRHASDSRSVQLCIRHSTCRSSKSPALSQPRTWILPSLLFSAVSFVSFPTSLCCIVSPSIRHVATRSSAYSF